MESESVLLYEEH